MPLINLNPILSAPVQTAAQVQNNVKSSGSSFSELLNSEISQEQVSGVKFSKHAQARLESRGIELNGSELDRLGSAVNAASQKGVNNSLIAMDSLAFIVNIPDRTVVTAMPVDEAGSNVFTNIDGAVIV